MSLSALQLYEIGRVFDPGVDPALYHPSAAGELLLPRLLVGVALQRLQGAWANVATLHFTAMDADGLLSAIAHALDIRLGSSAEGAAAPSRCSSAPPSSPRPT